MPKLAHQYFTVSNNHEQPWNNHRHPTQSPWLAQLQHSQRLGAFLSHADLFAMSLIDGAYIEIYCLCMYIYIHRYCFMYIHIYIAFAYIYINIDTALYIYIYIAFAYIYTQILLHICVYIYICYILPFHIYIHRYCFIYIYIFSVCLPLNTCCWA